MPLEWSGDWKSFPDAQHWQLLPRNLTHKALAAAIMGILFIVQTYTGLSFWWATQDTIATIIGLVTPTLVWAIPNKKMK